MFTEVHKMSHRDILAQVGGNHTQEKADQVSQLQATVLAPIQEGMQSVPDSQVRNAG